MREPGTVQFRHQLKADKRHNQGLFLGRLDRGYNNWLELGSEKAEKFMQQRLHDQIGRTRALFTRPGVHLDGFSVLLYGLVTRAVARETDKTVWVGYFTYRTEFSYRVLGQLSSHVILRTEDIGSRSPV